jgi:hypothetical protein
LYLTDRLTPYLALSAASGLILLEHAEGVTVEEIRAKTGAPFRLSPDLRVMQQEAVRGAEDHELAEDEHAIEINHHAVRAVATKLSSLTAPVITTVPAALVA